MSILISKFYCKNYYIVLLFLQIFTKLYAYFIVNFFKQFKPPRMGDGINESCLQSNFSLHHCKASSISLCTHASEVPIKIFLKRNLIKTKTKIKIHFFLSIASMCLKMDAVECRKRWKAAMGTSKLWLCPSLVFILMATDGSRTLLDQLKSDKMENGLAYDQI